MGIVDCYSQNSYGVRQDWGPVGAAAVGAGCACLVVVDVLSFSTAVSVLVERGTRVYPYRWRDEAAAEFARRNEAALAVGRGAVTAAAPWSLSPAVLRAAPFTPRLVLPSPNGSAIAAATGGTVPVLAGCLRNATAVGTWLAGRGWGTSEQPVAVIAAGERWPDGSLRPALEDLLGAGAVISALRQRRRVPLSPEAEMAALAFETNADIEAAVRGSASGRELIEMGFGGDVDVALERDSARAVPLSANGVFAAVE